MLLQRMSTMFTMYNSYMPVVNMRFPFAIFQPKLRKHFVIYSVKMKITSDCVSFLLPFPPPLFAISKLCRSDA